MVEEDFQQSKGQVGLDQSQVRRYRSWLRHTILAIAAHAIHAVTAARQREHHPAPVLPAHGEGTPPEDCGMTALTVPETHRLFVLHDETHDLSPLAPRPSPLAAARRTAFHERWSTLAPPPPSPSPLAPLPNTPQTPRLVTTKCHNTMASSRTSRSAAVLLERGFDTVHPGVQKD